MLFYCREVSTSSDLAQTVALYHNGRFAFPCNMIYNAGFFIPALACLSPRSALSSLCVIVSRALSGEVAISRLWTAYVGS